MGITIGIDFDGTCVTHEFPLVGKDIGAESVLKELVEKGHKLILFTMRSDKKDVQSDNHFIHAVAGQYLTDAVNWFKQRNIPCMGFKPIQHKCHGQLLQKHIANFILMMQV